MKEHGTVMEFLNQAMLFLLNGFHSVLGSYALAIIALTVVIRMVLWPLNTAQAKSMKTMQTLQPKLKALQERHKDDPAKMQQELMKLYSENKFNPMAGCLPMLVQLPIFIGLYGALMTPAFMQQSGNESFLFIDRLSNTWRSNGSQAFDNQFSVNAPDKFTASGAFLVKLKGQAEPQKVRIQDFRISDPNKLLLVNPHPLIPGEPVSFTLLQTDLGYDESYMARVESIKVPVTNTASKEVEDVTLLPTEKGNAFNSTLPTQPTKNTIHYDVLGMIIAYGLLTWAYQRSMSAMNPTPADANGMQAAMTKWMPILFTAMMFFIPIPAGVMLYLLATMVMMLIQNLWISRQDTSTGAAKPNQQVVTIVPDKA
jgi:YidC/Oxa1 family membrane protein insertase